MGPADAGVLRPGAASCAARADGCAKALEGHDDGVDQYVGDKAYDTMLDHIAYTPHLPWGYGYIPRLTDVHGECMCR